MSCKTF